MTIVCLDMEGVLVPGNLDHLRREGGHSRFARELPL